MSLRECSVGVSVKEAQNRLSSDEPGCALQVRLFGPMTLSLADKPIRLVSRKSRALLAYLVLRNGAEVPRGVLTGLLWGHRSEDQARASLRQSLSDLRRALAPAGAPVQASREAVSLQPSLVWSDALLFEAACEAPLLASEAANLYRGELLEGLLIDEPDFDHWLAGERERFRLLALSVFSTIMAEADAGNRAQEAVNWGLKLLTLDGLQEHVHRKLMRLYVAQGRPDAALAQYEQCRRVLAEQLAVRPEAATEALARELRAARHGSGSPATAASGVDLGRPDVPPLPRRPSIAVLRFRTIGAQEVSSDYFAEGVAEDIITELSRNSELFVVARHSSFAIEVAPSDPPAVRRTLGVRYLLTGSVRRAGARLRLSVHLRDSESGNEVWTEHYDRQLADIFDLQDEIARTISATVFGRIAEHNVEISRSRRPSDLSAYDFVLRGMQHMQRYSPEDYEQAQACFEKAVEVDPEWARPHGYLCLIGIYRWFWNMDQHALPALLAAGENALALDSHDARAHLALGLAHLFSWKHNRAIHHFERAVSLNPNDDLIACEHGRLLLYLDRPEDGLMRVREAMRLNPFHPNWYWNIYGRCLHTAGRYEEAIAAFERVETMQFWILAYLAACHAMIGEYDSARDYTRQVRAARPDFSLATFQQILPYRNAQSHERFVETFHRAGLN